MQSFPQVITPELLIKGRENVSINVVPAFNGQNEDADIDWKPDAHSEDKLREEFAKYSKVSQRLLETYNAEFINSLVDQSTNKADRYKLVRHDKLKVGDVVLLKEPLLKANQFPMAVVRKTIENYLGEVTNVEVFKGCTRELVKRHVTSIVPLIREIASEFKEKEKNPSKVVPKKQCRPQRSAALNSIRKTRDLLNN